MNYRKLVVSSTHETQQPYADFSRVVVRRDHTFSFDIVVYENGTRIMRKLFHSSFTDFDLHGDEEQLALKIIHSMKDSKELYVYGEQRPEEDGNEWTNQIIMDDRTKEIFSWLSKYTQKLIESF